MTKPMKFIFASDSFKGTISSQRTSELLKLCCDKVICGSQMVSLPIADGGEGTMDAVVAARNGEIRSLNVHDPLYRPVEAYYGHLSDTEAIFEMASASGLPLLIEEQRNPLLTSSIGTGEILLYLIRQGYRNITIAIGGSATNDGGIGMLKGLGARFFDQDGQELKGCGQDLIQIASMDFSSLPEEINQINLTVLCDVTNPLTGPTGATYTFGPQKGADEDMLKQLEEGMCHYRDLLIEKFGINADEIAGAGAAGGLGAALSICLKGQMKSGIETVLDLIRFDSYLPGTDYIITGEGRTDWQTVSGKVVQGVGIHAKKHNIPVIDLCGCTGQGYEAVYEYGVQEVITTAKQGVPLEEALANAEQFYMEAAEEMFAKLKQDR